MVESTLSFLKGHTLEVVERIRNDLDGCTQIEIEMRQIIATLELRLREMLIIAMKAKIGTTVDEANHRYIWRQ